MSTDPLAEIRAALCTCTFSGGRHWDHCYTQRPNATRALAAADDALRSLRTERNGARDECAELARQLDDANRDRDRLVGEYAELESQLAALRSNERERLIAEVVKCSVEDYWSHIVGAAGQLADHERARTAQEAAK